MRKKLCGNCQNFIRVKTFNKGRNGLCGILDYNCNTDSSFAKHCKYYKGTKHKDKL